MQDLGLTILISTIDDVPDYLNLYIRIMEIICQDALVWLKAQPKLCNVVTGICDMDEMPGYTYERYMKFFNDILNLIFSKLMPGCYAIFIQTDRKYNRTLIDKSAIISKAAGEHGLKTVWHKIVLHRDVGATDIHRPTYAHMLCYSIDGTTGAAVPDVLPVSKRLYKNGTPTLAAQTALGFVRRYSSIPVVIDPFVGQGTIPMIASGMGLKVIGIDIDPKQCQITRENLRRGVKEGGS